MINTINIGKSWDHEFKFVRVKDFDEVIRNQFVEPFQEMFDLVLNILSHFIVAKEFDVFMFVWLIDQYMSSVWLEFDGLERIELILFIGKSKVCKLGNVILYDPLETFVELVVLVFDIMIGQRLSKNVFVKGSGKICVE